MIRFFVVSSCALVFATACTTLPSTRKIEKHAFPKKDAFVGVPERPHDVIGRVRTKVTWPSLLNPEFEDDALCKNFYNKAAADLVKRARDAGGDAVADIKTVVFLADGRQEIHSTPECVDDGEEGEILATGVVVRWKKDEKAR